VILKEEKIWYKIIPNLGKGGKYRNSSTIFEFVLRKYLNHIRYQL